MCVIMGLVVDVVGCADVFVIEANKDSIPLTKLRVSGVDVNLDVIAVFSEHNQSHRSCIHCKSSAF